MNWFSIRAFAAALSLGMVSGGAVADTSGADIKVSQTQETRFGKALLVSTDISTDSTIMFNGKKVFEDEGVVSMDGYFRTKDADVILVSSNPGGSGTPDTQMYFLVIHSASQVEVLTDPDFVADTPNTDELKKWMDKDGRIFVNLDFRGGHEMVAELNSGKLVVHAYSRKGIPLPDDLCQWLYDKGMETCQSDEAHEAGCGKYSRHAGIGTEYSPHYYMTQFYYIRNQPGYNQAGLNKSCLAWCKGEDISYQQFRKTTCGTK